MYYETTHSAPVDDEPAALLRGCDSLWPDARMTIERIHAGMTNANYVITVDSSRRYFAQHLIAGDAVAQVGIDRTRQLATHQHAARLGLAPQLIYANLDDHVLITDFIDGSTLTPDRAREPAMIRGVAQLLRTLHRAPVSPDYDAWVSHPFRGLWNTAALARRHLPAAVDEMEPALALMRCFERARGTWSPALTHIDLLCANLMTTSQRLWLIDWEYAGLGDPLYDLGDFAGKNELPHEAVEQLLTDYSGHLPEARDVAIVELYGVISLLRESLWAIAMTALADNGFDHAGYAEDLKGRALAAALSAPVAVQLSVLDAGDRP